LPRGIIPTKIALVMTQEKRTLAKDCLDKVGEKVLLFGWLDSIRDHGKITFLDLRDRSGIIQCVGESLGKLNEESVVEISGLVRKRPDNLINTRLDTGTVELEIKKLEIISKSKEAPIPLSSDGLDIEEAKRLKYRYLDLRRPRMSKNIHLRSKITQYMRNWLIDRDFCEIETPILTKTTPEGARDFIVPSRLQKGKFYALPQSPQQYKQLLMVAGFERYFQIARCFRDEDPRADRAYGEFTQLDIEMSFVTQEDILALSEEMFTQLVKTLFPEKKITSTPWPRISHKEAMEKYKSDRPDLRKDKKNKDELAFAWIVDFPLFTKQSAEDYFHGSGKAKWAPSHHMFTAPNPDDIKLLDKDPSKVRGLQHDMVLNGFEVGGGSIRIHDAKIQSKIFELIGFSKEQKEQFEHMLRAFEYGVPPHGGIAPGIDRFMMVALGEPSVRESIAFPMTANGSTAVMDAPSHAQKGQLSQLGIALAASKKKS
jgi:aspartyl-tRNA synthetase